MNTSQWADTGADEHYLRVLEWEIRLRRGLAGNNHSNHVHMFSNVVYKHQDGSWSLEGITFVGNIQPRVKYDSLENIPQPIQDAIKRLMWLSPNDTEGITNIGLRVGETTYWISKELTDAIKPRRTQKKNK